MARLKIVATDEPNRRRVLLGEDEIGHITYGVRLPEKSARYHAWTNGGECVYSTIDMADAAAHLEELADKAAAVNPASPKPTSVLAEAAEARERGRRYGTPIGNMARLAERWSRWRHIPDGPLKSVVFMVEAKLARLEEDPSHWDSWVDVAGYADMAGAVLSDDRKIMACLKAQAASEAEEAKRVSISGYDKGIAKPQESVTLEPGQRSIHLGEHTYTIDNASGMIVDGNPVCKGLCIGMNVAIAGSADLLGEIARFKIGPSNEIIADVEVDRSIVGDREAFLAVPVDRLVHMVIGGQKP